MLLKASATMEVDRRRNPNNNKRKPLSNITNTIISPSTTTISNNTSTGSNNADTLNPKTSSHFSHCPTPHVDVHCENSKKVKLPSKRPSVVKAKDKGKAVAVAVVSSSCPPPKRSKTAGDEVQKGQRDRNKIYEGHSGISQSKLGTAYSWEREKEEDYSMSEEDAVFIDKQRAYFSEIDAFELLEEVVSESELE